MFQLSDIANIDTEELGRKSLFSIGNSCQVLQTSPDELRKLMNELDIEFSFFIDSIGYLSGDDLQRVCGLVQQRAAKIAAQAESN